MITHKKFSLILLLAGSIAVTAAGTPAADWDELRRKNLDMGFTTERVDRTVRACRAHGLTVAQAEDLLTPLYTAYRENLPSDCIFLKIEEGLAKRVDWRDVRTEADKRLAHARTADRLASSIPLKPCETREHMVAHICMALESGVAVDVLEALFSHEGSARTRRLIYIVTAGETLQLSGLAAEDIQHILVDCMDRDLTCAEVDRVVETLLERHKSGVSFDEIHDDLWIQSDR